jgi:glycosyltransferase involved in cell wall biosynthesis
MNKTVVSINGRFLGRSVTGVDRFAIEILSAIDRMHDRADDLISGLRFQIFVPPNVTGVIPFRNIPVREVGRFNGQIWEQVDLPRAVGLGLLVSLCNTAPIFHGRQVVAIHDAATVAIPSAFSTSFRLWYRLLMPAIGWRALKILTPSVFSRSELSSHFGVEPEKIEIVSEGGEHILRAVANSTLLDRQELRQRPYVLAVSSQAVHKNFQLVLRAIENISNPPFDIVVAGGSNPRVFGKGGMIQTDRIKWLGYVSDAELRTLYEGAMCFVFPSLYEGFGIPPLEAMNCGCPVIASRAASIPEVCGDAALYFDPHDPDELSRLLVRVAGDGLLRSEMVARGFQRAREFSWDKGARQLISICRGVMNSAPHFVQA